MASYSRFVVYVVCCHMVSFHTCQVLHLLPRVACDQMFTCVNAYSFITISTDGHSWQMDGQNAECSDPCGKVK